MGNESVQGSSIDFNSETAKGTLNRNEVLTTEFQEHLLASEDPQKFIDSKSQTELNLVHYLRDLLSEKCLARKDVVRRARLNETYGWEIFSDPSKRPGRDKLLAIAFAMSLSVVETRRLLRHGRVNELYSKNKRDALIIVCLNNNASLEKVDEVLYAQKLPTITER